MELGQGNPRCTREESSQLMTFFGALLMVGPHVGTADVWALLSDSLCRWWVSRVDLASSLPEMFRCPTGEAGQTGEAGATLRHLLGPSAVVGSGHQAVIDPQLSMWRDRCKEVWKAVLSWLHFGRDRVIPPPRPPPVMSPPRMSKNHCPKLPRKAIKKRTSSQQEGNGSAAIVHPQMEELERWGGGDLH